MFNLKNVCNNLLVNQKWKHAEPNYRLKDNFNKIRFTNHLKVHW